MARLSIIPVPDVLTQPYWDGAARGELLIQRCTNCGTVWHPPMPLCPTCHSANVQWVETAGLGTVYSYTDVHHSVHRATDGWGVYRIVVIELDEGPRLVSSMAIEGSDQIIGRRVRVVFEPLSADIVLPRFAFDDR